MAAEARGAGVSSANLRKLSLAGASAEGTDLYLYANRALNWENPESRPQAWDARIGGGFAEPPAPAAPCDASAEGACQGASQAAPAAAPGAASKDFGGPGNVKPKPHKKKTHKKKRHRRHHHKKRQGPRQEAPQAQGQGKGPRQAAPQASRPRPEGREMKARRILCAGALALSAALALAPLAQAEETTPAVAWKVVAATGPTNLAPQQSEVQKLVIGAEGGTFTLGRKTAGTGKGTPVTVNGGLSVSEGSPTATILAGAFEVGARITTTTANTIPAETTILSCTPGCTPGSTLTLSAPAEATNTHLGVKTYTAKISALTQSGLHVGDVISGTGLAAGTTITELGPDTLTASKPTTAAYSSGQLSFTAEERTPQLPYNSSAAALEAALEALPAFPAGTFTVWPAGTPGPPT